MGRATKHELEGRTEAARLLLLKGHDPALIAQGFAAAFDITTRQARNYIARAQEQIRAVVEVDRAYRLAEHIAVRRDLRQRAISSGELHVALNSARDEAKLLDLYPPARLAVDVRELSDEDLNAIIDGKDD